MIGRIRGTLENQGGERVLVMTASGVGYEIVVPARTLACLPALGEEVSLHVHTHVREDAIVLFGFHDEVDRAAFRILQDVNGVGPKLALAVVGSSDPRAVAAAIERDDVRALSRIPGVGAKTAARMCLELKGRLSMLTLADLGTTVGPPRPSPAMEDATAALASLGYNPKEIERALLRVEPSVQDTVQTLLRRALQVLSPG